MSEENNNRQILDNMLIEIQNKIGKVNSKILFEELEKISQYKPLTSLYFNTLAELYYTEEMYEEVFSTLNGKENWWRPSVYAAKSAQIFSKTFSSIGDAFHSNLYNSLEVYLSQVLNKNSISKKSIEDMNNEILGLQDGFFKSKVILDYVKSMFLKYTELWRFVEAAIMLAVEVNFLKIENLDYNIDKYINEFKVFELNIGYLMEQLITKKDRVFVLIADSNNDYLTYATLAKALALLGIKVKLVAQLISIEVEKPVSLNDTVMISIENIENIDGYELVHPIEVICNGESIGDNTILLIDTIVKSTKDEYANLITTRDIFDSLSDTSEFNMRVQCLSGYRGEFYNNFISFGYVGEYISYINRVYNINYIEDISKESDCEFSIVIPARNSAYTLQYTLQTCLEQRGMTDKDYEIVVSDNSDNGNKDVFNLVRSLNDKKIKYFHTPRNLPLNRSFEFAFSKARGKMIIPIGSDDGILPWGLETLRKCMVDFPNIDVFAWHRGFFQWAESKNSRQAGKLVIPRFYKKSEYNIAIYDCIKALSTLINNPDELMYTVPTLYINSGFRRNYLNKILNKTGRLWDGYTQDIYMSIVNLLINDGYAFMEFPITIAGMSDNSLGAKSVKIRENNDILLERHDEFFAENGFGNSMIGRYKFEGYEVDISLFWAEIFRLLENKELYKKLMPILEKCSWQDIFGKIVDRYSPSDLNYNIQLNVMRNNAYRIGEDIGNYFDINLYQKCLEKIYVFNEESNDKNDYFTGFGNGLTLDARKFGVSNIYEATKLFGNITNL